MLNERLLLSAAESFGLCLSREALDRLELFARLLAETNKQFNLTAITEPDEVTVKHFADSLSLYKFVDFPQGASLIDVGTGAGFPGLALLLTRPDLKLTFLDASEKKLRFVERVLKETGARGRLLHSRAEDAGRDAAHRGQYDFAAARAVADLSVLSEYCLPLVRPGGTFIAMKSAAAEAEIAAARGAIHILGGELERNELFDLVENTPRRLVLIRKISQTPPKYPRSSAKIVKKILT